MSRMLTGSAGLKAEYVTVPVAPGATLSAGLVEHANTIVEPLVAPERFEHVVDTFAVGGVQLREWEKRTTAAARPIARAIATTPISSFTPRATALRTIGRRPRPCVRRFPTLAHSSPP